MENEYYLLRAGSVLGPLSVRALREMAAQGRLLPGDQVSQDGQSWVPAEDVRGLITGEAVPTRSDDRRAFDVFISYSSQNKREADVICGKLEAGGIRCWIAPRDIVPGTEWTESIIEGIEKCRVMVLVFSEHANGSQQVRREVERAMSKELAVIPFRVQDVAPTKSLEYCLGGTHWLDAFDPPLERHVERLAEVVKRIIGERPAARQTKRNGEQKHEPAGDAPGEKRVKGKRKRAVMGVLAAVVIGAVGIGIWASHGGGSSATASEAKGNEARGAAGAVEGEDLTGEYNEVTKQLRTLGTTRQFLLAHASQRADAWLKAAERGDARGAYLLGCCYQWGIGEMMDFDREAAWFRKAADGGLTPAMVALGECYVSGSGVRVDLGEAMKWFTLAADNGDPMGMTDVGCMLEWAVGVPKDMEKAKAWLTRAANAGCAEAMNELGGLYYELGWEAENPPNASPATAPAAGAKEASADYAATVEWYQRAAAAGNTDALMEIGDMYFNGNGVAKDEEQALHWYERAAASGAPDGYSGVGEYWQHRQIDKSLESLKKGAAAGSSRAMGVLGDMYLNDGGGVDTDEDEGLKWREAAAMAGSPVDAVLLGDKSAATSDPAGAKDALRWYTIAANVTSWNLSEKAKAMVHIGDLYAKGRFGAVDDATAFAWYKDAANFEDIDAWTRLGRMYFEGRGTARDLNKAKDLFARAAERDDAMGMCGMGLICKTNGETESAQAWYKKALEKDDADVMCAMGYLLKTKEAGGGKEARDWFERASDKGNGEASYQLALCYDEMSSDDADQKAINDLLNSATQGYVPAMLLLAKWHESGRHNMDKEGAQSWYQNAANYGDEGAKKWLKEHPNWPN